MTTVLILLVVLAGMAASAVVGWCFGVVCAMNGPRTRKIMHAADVAAVRRLAEALKAQIAEASENHKQDTPTVQ